MVELEIPDVFALRRTTTDGHEVTNSVILLREKGGPRILPVWVGESEATSVALALEGFEPARPTAYHFAAALLASAGAKVESVTISKLVKDTFYATVSIKRGRTVAQVDARPSDAINLALRTHAPLFAEEQVLKKAGKRVRLPKGERAGAPALVEHYQEHDRLANAPVSETEAAQFQAAWREYGLEFLDE